MAFKKVGGPRVFFKYSECSPGDILVPDGVYKGAEEGKYGIVHIFDCDGTTHCLNSAGKLNYDLEKNAVPGSRCRITYEGKITLTKGAMAGKESHQFLTEIDDGSEPYPTPGFPQAVQVQPKGAEPAQVAAKAVVKKNAAVVTVGDDIEL